MPRLYIVDSDDSVRDGLSRLAEAAGFDVHPCAGAAELLRRAPKGAGACALIDLSDAGLRDEKIRTRLARLAAALPCIALSVRDDAHVRRVARELGARAFFRKPVDASALLDSIAWLM